MFEYMDMNMTIFHGLSMFIFWFILIYLLFSILNKSEKDSKESALDILKKRFAKGEITKEQFDKIKKSLV